MLLGYSFIVFGFLLIYQVVNKNKFGVVSYLIFVYCLSFFCSLVLKYIYGFRGAFQLSHTSFLYFIFTLGIVFLGFFSYRDNKLKKIVIINWKSLKIIEYSYALLALIACFFFVSQSFTMLISSDIGSARSVIASEGAINLQKLGVFNSFFSLIANLFMLAMVFGFLNMTPQYPGAKLWKAVAHFSLSSVYILYILSYLGRDGFVYWVMSFIFLFLFFKEFLVARQYKILIKYLLIMLIPFFVLFMLISLSRFGQDSILFSFFSYAGQQIYYFNDHFIISAPVTYGASNFAPVTYLISDVFGLNIEHFNRTDWFIYFLDRDVIPWVFSTFIGSFLHDFGKVGTLVLCTFIALCISYTLRNIKRGVILFSDLILFILLYQIVLWGVFYYKQAPAFFYLVVMLLLFVFFRFSGGTSKIIINKV